MEADEELGEYGAAFDKHGNFTICALLDESGGVAAMGAAKRNPNDTEDARVGRHLSFARAVNNLNSEE